ncbi:AcrR family transcriptional regulator [Catenulispora sp. EB89]|uniref:TetR/AcrR family transcriptional regulator n=1 Tax=Catenulispora sp. EB89 TaxID=3156257 RepID=UPI003518FBE9
MFGKPGRPAEDRIKRQQEIFLAVAPLIGEYGGRAVTMTRAARAANMSVGGLYHYFSTKRELLLFGIAPANFERLCADFRQRHGHLAATDPRALLAISLDTLTSAAGAFVAPSVLAAAELGVPTLRAHLDEALTTEVVGLVDTIRLAYPALTTESATVLGRALRHQCATRLLDPELDPADLRTMLEGTVAAFTVIAPARASAGNRLQPRSQASLIGRSDDSPLKKPLRRAATRGGIV